MKLGVREVCDVVLKAKANTKIGSHVFRAGEPVIYLDTATTSSLEGAATTVYGMGGKGNPRLIAWEGEKTLTFTFEDALISPKGIAILTGANLIGAGSKKADGTFEVITAHTTQNIEVTEKGKITLDTTHGKPSTSAAADMYVMLLDMNGEMSGVPMKVGTNGISHADGVITCPFVDVNDVVMVDYYVDYTSDAQQIDITPEQFAGFYYLEASTLFRRQVDGVDLPAEFIIPKVKIQSNFTFTLASSGDPSSFTFTMDAFPDYTKFDRTKQVLAAIQVLNADDNYDLTGAGDDEDDTVTYKRYEYNKDGGSYIGVVEEGKQTDDDTEWNKE